MVQTNCKGSLTSSNMIRNKPHFLQQLRNMPLKIVPKDTRRQKSESLGKFAENGFEYVIYYIVIKICLCVTFL